MSLEEFLSSFKESDTTRRSNSNDRMESSDIGSENLNSNSDSSNLTISNKRIRIKLPDSSEVSDSRANTDVSDVLSERSDTIVSGSRSSENSGNLSSDGGLESANIGSQSRTISRSRGRRTSTSVSSNSSNGSELRSGVDDEGFYERMFLRSGTSSSRREEWFSMISRARSSRKRTFLTSKILEGKFRITEMGKLEILPDLDISDRSLSEIMRLNWLKR